MAKIDRYDGNLQAPASAALGTERTLFGSASQSDDLTDQFNADLLRGWGIVGPSDQPTLQDFNAMGFTLGQIHAYLHQMGVAEWNVAQEYHLGSIANVAGVLYVSLVNTNVGNIPSSSPSQWFSLTQGGIVAFTSAGVTNWTVPLAMQLGIIKPKVTVIGGGGGASRVSASVGISGAGGGTAIKYAFDLTGITAVPVTVGAGGAGKDITSAGDGIAGGTSSFGVYMSALGGAPGLNSPSGRPQGGTALGGDINIPGQAGGQLGLAGGSAAVLSLGGQGLGASVTSASGINGLGFGAGGGGGKVDGAGTGAGGNGSSGGVLIEW